MLENISPGSKIAVVAPAGPAPREPLEAGLAILARRYRVVHDLERQVRPPASLPYLSADDKVRAAALTWAMTEPGVGAVIFARGGYGSSRLLTGLDPTMARRGPTMVGFSDITALHAWAARAGASSVHGPVVTQLGRLPPGDVQGLFDLLEGRPRLPVGGLRALRRGLARGPLWGGNLTLISHLCGTPHLPDLAGKVLLMEEVGESPYRVDRMLTQLRLAGVLRRVSGVLVGELVACKGPGDLERVLEERLGDLGVPVLLGAPVGHGDRNLALPLGIPVELDGNRGELRY